MHDVIFFVRKQLGFVAENGDDEEEEEGREECLLVNEKR